MNTQDIKTICDIILTAEDFSSLQNLLYWYSTYREDEGMSCDEAFDEMKKHTKKASRIFQDLAFIPEGDVDEVED